VFVQDKLDSLVYTCNSNLFSYN